MIQNKAKKKRKLPSWMAKEKNEGSISKTGKGEENPVPQVSSDLLLDKEPVKYDNSITYCSHFADCAAVCEDLLTRLDAEKDVVFGFDMEWPATYTAGSQAKTALIQLSPSATECYLFHIAHMSGLPGPLKRLLQDKRCLKVGVGIESDIWKLGRDFDFDSRVVILESMRDLGAMANQVLGSHEKWSLDGLCQHLFHKRLMKDDVVRKSDWRDFPLSEAQKLYAATDAYASLQIYEVLRKRFTVADEKPPDRLHFDRGK